MVFTKMNKIAWFFLLLLFIMMGGLFFASGFLTCYILFPPRPQSFIPSPSRSQVFNPSVMSSSPFSKVDLQKPWMQDARHISQHNMQMAGQSYINQTLDTWSQKIQNLLGPIFGASVIPLTTGLAKSLIDEKLIKQNQNSPQRNSVMLDQNQNNKVTGDPPSKVTLSNPITASNQILLPEPQTSSTKYYYTLQIQDFDDHARALNQANQLQNHHFGAYVVKNVTPNGIKFSVRAGTFISFQQARDAATLLNGMWNIQSRVVVLEKPFTLQENSE